MLKISTARNLLIFMTDSADHITGKTGLTLTITASKDGAAFASISPTVTDLGSGWYGLALTTTHTNTKGDLCIHITSAGADPSDIREEVFTDLPGDSVSSVTGNVAGSVGSVTGAVGSVTGAVGSVTGAVGSVTGNVGGNVTGSVGSVVSTVAANLTQILGTALTETSGQIAAAFKQFFNIASPTSTMNVITTVTTATNLTTNNDKTGYTVSTVSDKTGYSLSSGGVQAIWDALTSALTTVGSIGKLLSTNIDATISSRLATSSYTAPDNADIALIKAKTDNLPAAPAAVSNIPTVSQITNGIWDEPIAGHLTTGSTGKALNSAGSAGDPWSTLLPGSYGAGTAGDILGTNLDAKVSLVKAKTDLIPAIPASQGDVTTVGSAVSSVSTKIGTPVVSVSADIAAVKAVDDAIKAKTDNLPSDPASNTQVLTRLATSGYTAPDNSGITAIKAKTDTLPASPASEATLNTVGASVLVIPTNPLLTSDLRLNTLDAAISTRAIPGDQMALSPAQIPVKKNTAFSGFTFPMYDSSGVLVTGLTVVAKRSVDGAALASCANVVSEVGSGFYKINFAAADLNGNSIAFQMSSASAKTTTFTVVTQ